MVEAAHRAAMAIEVNRRYLTALAVSEAAMSRRFHSQQSLGRLIDIFVSATGKVNDDD